MLGFLMALLPLIPNLIGLADEKAGKVAGALVPAVQALTGQTEPEAAVAALKADPTLLLQAQKIASDALLAVEREDTERLRIVNETIRAEANSADEYVRRWRPYWGYWSARAWVAQTFAVCISVVGATIAGMMGHATEAREILAGIASLVDAMTIPWVTSLAVLGVSVVQRSKDKNGGSPLDLLGMLGRKGKP